MTRPRVLIVGAGPTGLTAAVELARGGIVPRIIEKRTAASALSRAVGITPATMDLLTPSGIATEIRNEAVPFSGAVFHRGADPIGRLTLPPNVQSRQMLGLPQDRTEHHLAQGFKRLGGQIEYGATLEHLIPETGMATVNSTSQTYDIIIGADGIQSMTRTAAGIAYNGVDLPETWSIADVEARGVTDPAALKLYLVGRGTVAMQIPLEAARWRIVSNTDDALAALPSPLDVTTIRRTGSFKISLKQALTYQSGSIFLAGDAAHCHSPVGGRGMNLGIADAADLAARILSGQTDGYSASRHPEGARIMQMTERARRMVTSTNPLTRWGVSTGMRLVGLSAGLQTRIIRQIMQ